MSMMIVYRVVSVVILGVAVLPAKVAACSGSSCGIQFAPGAVMVPANLPGFALSVADSNWQAHVTVTSEDGEQVSVDSKYQLQSELMPGKSYDVGIVVDASARCPRREFQTTVTAVASSALPTTLGDPIVIDQGRGPTAVGFTAESCYTVIDSAFVDLEPSLEGDALPWKSAIFSVRAVVDGKPYWVSSEEQPQELFYPTGGRGYRPFTGGDLRVRIFRACEDVPPGSASSYHPLAEGSHRVKLVGTLPGFGELETSETEIVFDCSGSAADDAGAATDAATGPGGVVDESSQSDSCSVSSSRGPVGWLPVVIIIAAQLCSPRARKRRSA